MQDVKGSSSKWINDKKLCPGRFTWQEGYGAFSYGKPEVHNIIEYIINQELHHKNQTFLQEYRRMLKDFDVNYDDQYVFKSVDTDS